MSLDFSLHEVRPCEIFSRNITHNLVEMAKEAGIYIPLWHPEEMGAKFARDIIDQLQCGLDDLVARPKYYKKFDSPNGWGMYDHFVPFVSAVLLACIQSPDAEIKVSR